MFDFFNYSFLVNALLLALILGISASIISPFIVLNKQSMIADGLSHVAFTGIIFGLLFSNEPMYIAIPFAIIASLLITFLSDMKRINHDAAIGVVSAFSLAIGLITVSLSSGFNRSIESLLVGFILTSNLKDIIIGSIILIIIIIFVIKFYRPLLAITHDESYAKFNGVKTKLIKYLLSVLTSVFIVIGVRTAGMLLISTYIIFPSLIAIQLSKNFKDTILKGAIVSVITIFIAFIISYNLDIPTPSTIVVCYTLILLCTLILRKKLAS